MRNLKNNKSIKINLVYNIIYHIVTVCTPLITSPIVSRSLGASQLGVYGFTYSIAFYFYLFGMLGVKNYGNRSIARARENRDLLNRTFSSVFVFQVVSSFFFLLLYIIYVVILCKENQMIAYAQALLVLSAMFDISWFFFGLEMFKTTSIRSTIIKISTVVLIVIFVRQPSDLGKYTLIMAGGMLLTQLVLWPSLSKFVTFKMPDFKSVISHFKPNLILFIPVIATNLFKYMDKIMLGKMTEMNELGYYENAERLIQVPGSLVTALGTVMLPRMSNLVGKNENDEAASLTYKSMLISVFACSAIAFGVVGVSDVFVPFFFGEEFLPVTPLLWFLAPTIIFISWGDVIKTQYLLPKLKDKAFLITVLVASSVNILVNYFLIPSFGARGAAIGTICAEFLVCFLQSLIAFKALPLRLYFRDCVPFILFGIVMYFSIYMINVDNLFLTLIIRVFLGGVIYLLLTYFYLLCFHKDILYSVIPSPKIKK